MSASTPSPEPAPRPFLGPGARALLVLACAVVVVAGLRAASQVLIPVFVGTFIAVLTLPMVFGLKRLGLPNWLAVTVSVIVDIGVLVGASFLVGSSINDLANSLDLYRERTQQLRQELPRLPEPARQFLIERGIPTPSDWAAEMIDADVIVNLVQGVLRGAATVLSNTLLVLLIAIFVLLEASTFPDKLAVALGRRDARARFGMMTAEIQRYLGLKTIVSLTTGSLIWLWAAILGVDFAVLWGIVAFLFNYIPNLGSILAAIPACSIALLQLGPGRALLLALGFAVVNVALGNFIEPNLMGRQLGLSTLVVFLSLVFWGWVWGPIGMFLSVPLTMIVKIALEYSEDLKPIAVLLGPSPDQDHRRLAAKASKRA